MNRNSCSLASAPLQRAAHLCTEGAIRIPTKAMQYYMVADFS